MNETIVKHKYNIGDKVISIREAGSTFIVDETHVYVQEISTLKTKYNLFIKYHLSGAYHQNTFRICSIFNENDLFLTQEAAQEEAARRNKEKLNITCPCCRDNFQYLDGECKVILDIT